jgi:hypothetical protein
MKFKSLFLIAAFVLLSCGSNKNLNDRAAVVKESSKRVLKNHYKNTFDEATLKAALKVNFKKGNDSKNFSVSLRIQKDETIWMSGAVFGFPVLKALITPNRVSYYIKPLKTYYEGDFTSLQALLGTDLNFSMLQNILVGDALLPLKSKNFVSRIDQQAHLLTLKKENSLAKLFFWIHPLHYKIEKQEIKSLQKKASLSISYKNYNKINNTYFPDQINIRAKDQQNQAHLRVQYKSVSLGKKLSFPYKIPSGYKKIN